MADLSASPGPVRAVDVARRAGVSTATVSLVANGKATGRISQELQERVSRAINDLGYIVNRSASSLVTGRRNCVALVARDMTNPVMSLIAYGVTEVLGADTQLLLAVSGPEASSSDVSKVVAFGVDGVLLHCPSAEQLAELPRHTPAVLLDYLPRSDRRHPRVFYDTSTGSTALAQHLVELGHERMVYLDAARPWATFTRRRQILTTEFAKGVRSAQVIRTPASSDVEDVKALVRDQWPTWRDQGVTVVVASMDNQAYGALAAFSEMGVDVPGAVSVAAFDNLPTSSLMTPSLTTVDLPPVTLGQAGASLLLKLIDSDDEAVAATTQLRTELVVRASTGPARSA